MAGRGVVISSDGGRLRLCETKQEPEVRRKGAGAIRERWREPKVSLVYVVDAEGKCDALFCPRDGCDAQAYRMPCSPLLRTSLPKRLDITQADHVLFSADASAVNLETGPLSSLVQALGLAAEQVHELFDFHPCCAAPRAGRGAAQRSECESTHTVAYATAPSCCCKAQVEQVIVVVQWSLPPAATARPGVRSRSRLRSGHRAVWPSCHVAHPHEVFLFGSGAIESAVRCCDQSLCLKGPSLFFRCSCQCRGYTPVAVFTTKRGGGRC